MPQDLKKKFDPIKMKDDIVRWVRESRIHYQRRFDEVDEFVKRYEAKRSIAGLMGWGDDAKANPKNEPWDNCSDIGIPLEAFTIEGLLPRFLKVCYGAKPIVWVRGHSEDDLTQAPVVQEALNFQLTNRVKIYRRMKQVFKNTVMAGDGIAKCVWETEDKIINRIVYYLQDNLTGQLVTDEQGNPIEVKKDDPYDNTLYTQIKEILSEPKKIYDGPKIYSRNIKQIVIPKDANTPEINELDWIADQYERTIDWCKHRIGNTEEGLFDEQAVLELEQDALTKSIGNRINGITNFSKVLITEWHGKYDVNGDGLDEEVVVFIGTADLISADIPSAVNNSKLLGWMITPYPTRPFFHYQIIPMDNSFYGKGVPEFLIGIRNLVDAIFNQMIDRGSITNNPPILVPPEHDPDENPFGPGQHWQGEASRYRVLELPKTEQVEFTKIEFLMALVQKLFGVTDYSLGTESTIASNRTASGIMTIVGEGNIKFDDMIRALQDVNEDLYDFIVQLDGEFLPDEFVYYVTESRENPFRKVNKKTWIGNFDFEAAGNSININREIEQNRATLAYNTAVNSYGKNPAITPEVMAQVTENFFRSIDMRNIKIPTPQELQQQKIMETAQALRMIEHQKQQELVQGVNKGGINAGSLAGIQAG